MKLVFLIAWRSLTSRPGRAVASVLGVAVGIATVLAVSTVDHNTILSQLTEPGPRMGDPDVELRPVVLRPEETLSLPALIEDDPAIAKVTGLFLNSGRVMKPGEPERSIDVRVCGFGAGTGKDFNAYVVEEGSDLTAPDEPGVLVPRKMATALGLAVGDEVVLQPLAPPVEGCIEGKKVRLRGGQEGAQRTASLRVTGILAWHNLGQQPDQVIIPFALGVSLYEGMHLQPIFWARLKPGAIYQDARVRLKDRFVVDKPKRALVGERVDQRAFRKGIRLSSLLSLLLGLFVIYNAFSMSLVERIRDIGFLRALGMSNREIRSAFLLEGSLVASVGVITGLLLAALIVLVMRWAGITSLGYGKPLVILEIPWGQVALVALLGLVIALVGVVAPLLRASELSVVEALRTGQAAFGERPRRLVRVAALVVLVAALPTGYMLITPPLGERQGDILQLVVMASVLLALVLGFLALLPGVVVRLLGSLFSSLKRWLRIEVQLARSAATQAKHRIQASVTGLMLVFTGILVIQAVTAALKDETDRFVDRAVDGRVFIRTQRVAAEKVEPVRSLPGVRKLYSLSAEVRVPFALRGVPPELLESPDGTPLLDAKAQQAFARGEGIILSSHLAASYGYGVGEMVRLSTFSGPKLVPVLAIDDRFGYFPDDRAYALLALDEFERLYCVGISEGDRYVATIGPGQERALLSQHVETALSGVPLQYVRTDADIRSMYTRDRDLDFLIFDVILFLTAFLAAVGMLNSLTIAVLERRREISLLHAVGLGRREIGTMLLLEAAGVGVMGGVLSLVLGGVLSYLAVVGLKTVSQLDVRAGFTAATVLVPLAGAFAVAILAALYPAWRSRCFERCDWE
ncbi:MAG: FtsX-like permease family protein [Planctomycetota bacterium]